MTSSAIAAPLLAALLGLVRLAVGGMLSRKWGLRPAVVPVPAPPRVRRCE